MKSPVRIGTPLSYRFAASLEALQNEFGLQARTTLGLPIDTGLRWPAGSAVNYGGLEAAGIARDALANALAVADDVETARSRAMQTAAWVIPSLP